MPSTYTLNNGIEIIGTGEQSGTWGDTTNTNLELIDTALDGQVTVTLPSAGTSGSPNALAISDGAASDGRNRMVIFDDSSDLGATAYVQLTPNDAEKIIYVRNALSGSRSIILFQGTYNASNDYEVPAGTTAVIYFDGGGAGAVAANVFNNAYFDSLRLGSVSVTAILDEDNMASDSATALATQQSIKAYVDATAAAQNELSEILANGNTTGGTDISVSSGDDITFADSSKAIFGAGSDLQIYHDGDNSYIDDAGTGQLLIRGRDAIVLEEIDSGDNYIYMQRNNKVELYYSGAAKLATTSTGIDVTGTVTADGLTFDGIGSDAIIEANTTSDSISTAAELLKLRAVIGSSQTEVGNIVIQNRGSSENQSLIRFQTASSGVLATRMGVDYQGDITFYDTSGNASFVYDESAGSTFNENGDNKDFRVESDTNNGAFFVDGGTSYVGINTSVPTTNLDVNGSVFLGSASFGSGSTVTINNSVGGTGDSLTIKNSAASLSGRGTRIAFASNIQTVAKIDSKNQTDNTGGSLEFTSSFGGTFYRNMFNGYAESVINPDSHDMDFRVESDTNTHALFVDAGASEVRINSANAINGASLAVAGSISFNAGDAGSFITDSAFIDYVASTRQLRLHSGAIAGQSSKMEIGTVISGVQRSAIEIDTSGNLTINEDSVDKDFRVESNSYAYMLFVDASANGVGINTNTPNTGILTVAGSANYVPTSSGQARNAGIHIDGGTAGGAGTYSGAISFGSGSGSAAIAGRQQTSDGDTQGLAFFIHNSGTGADDAVEAMRIEGSGDLNLSNGGGIIFSDAGSSGTSTSNNLDSYEEGTWTPVLKGSSGATKTWTYSAAQGYYTKVGNQVTVWFNIQLSSNGSGTDGNAYIDGLPFASANLSNLTNYYGFFWKQLVETGDVALQGRNQINTATIALQDGSSSYPDITPLNTSVFLNDRRIRGTFTYSA